MNETKARFWASTLGLAQLNTLTAYPSILTQHERGEKGKLVETHTTRAVRGIALTATEKINGTSVRILVFADGSYLIGGRETLLHHSGDLLYDPDNGVVAGLLAGVLQGSARQPTWCATVGHSISPLTVIYGEAYGGSIGPHKQYSSGVFGFRVFDVAVFETSEALEQLLKLAPSKLSLWRESSAGPGQGLRYGQPFLPESALNNYCECRGLNRVPTLGAILFTSNLSLIATQKLLTELSPATQARTSPAGLGGSEGVVLTSADRLVRVKLRHEDYARSVAQPCVGAM